MKKIMTIEISEKNNRKDQLKVVHNFLRGEKEIIVKASGEFISEAIKMAQAVTGKLTENVQVKETKLSELEEVVGKETIKLPQIEIHLVNKEKLVKNTNLAHFLKETRDPFKVHNKGNELYGEGDFGGALKCYDREIEIDPTMMEAYFNRGLTYTRLKNYSKAEEDMNKCIEMNPKLAEVYYTRGLVKEYVHDYTAAALDYARALGVDENYHKALNQLEVCVKKAKTDQQPAQTPASAPASTPSYKPQTQSKSTDRDLTDFNPYKENTTGLTLKDYGGDSPQKELIKRLCLLFENRDIIRKRGGQLPGGVLLYGPPGTGKTYLTKIFANEIDAVFYNIKSTDIFSKWLGDSSKNMQNLFDEAADNDMAIIFFDEIDGIAARRGGGGSSDSYAERKVLSSLLTSMDGISEKYGNIIVMGATNDFEILDKALLRPGRLDHIIKVEKPDIDAIREIYKIQVKAVIKRAEEPLIAKKIDYQLLADISMGLVGDDIKEVIERTVNEEIFNEINKKKPYKITTTRILKVLRNYSKEKSGNLQVRKIGFFGGLD